MRPDGFLETLQIARPCDARWDDMVGGARVRHCGACRLNVYDLSQLTRVEATELVQRTEGKLCIRMLRRADGTVVTDDCMDRLTAARRSGVSTFAAALALTGAMLAAACGVGAEQVDDPITETTVQGQVVDQDEPQALMGAEAMPEHELTLGKVAPMMGAPIYIPTSTTGDQ